MMLFDMLCNFIVLLHLCLLEDTEKGSEVYVHSIWEQLRVGFFL